MSRDGRDDLMIRLEMSVTDVELLRHAMAVCIDIGYPSRGRAALKAFLDLQLAKAERELAHSA